MVSLINLEFPKTQSDNTNVCEIEKVQSTSKLCPTFRIHPKVGLSSTFPATMQYTGVVGQWDCTAGKSEIKGFKKGHADPLIILTL